MKILLLNFLLALSMLSAAGGTVQSRVEAILSGSKVLQGAAVGIKAVTAGGEVLADVESDRLLVPASNMKILTTAAALDRLGVDFRFKTTLAYSGTIHDGVLYGNLFLIGGADPTIACQDPAYPKVEVLFAEWKKMLESAGISRIEGLVVGDGSYIDGMKEHPDWEWADVGTYYGTGVSGLQFCGNTLNFRISPGSREGDKLALEQVYPMTPWMKISYDCCTGPKGSGDMIYLYTTDFSNNAVLRGTFALEKPAKTVKCSNKRPELTCAREFSLYLTSSGIANRGYSASRAEDVEILGRTVSEELRNIVKTINHKSDNLFAETVLRVMGKTVSGKADYDSAVAVEKDILRSMGVPVGNEAILRDGSGLSGRDRVTASYMCRLLLKMMERPCWKDFLGSLPSPCSEGTVSNMLSGLSEAVRSRVFMKSGTHTGVRAFSGYYLPEGKPAVVFSVIVNNSTASSAALSAAIDEILEAVVSD